MQRKKHLVVIAYVSCADVERAALSHALGIQKYSLARLCRNVHPAAQNSGVSVVPPSGIAVDISRIKIAQGNTGSLPSRNALRFGQLVRQRGVANRAVQRVKLPASAHVDRSSHT